jgi:galactoside 2-L-fucosyltransferase 1/2
MMFRSSFILVLCLILCLSFVLFSLSIFINHNPFHSFHETKKTINRRESGPAHFRQLVTNISFDDKGFFETSVNWDDTLLTQNPLPLVGYNLDFTETTFTNSTQQLHTKNPHPLWRFYNKETPSLYDAFRSLNDLIFIFQTKKGHCRRCIGKSDGGSPLIEYGIDPHKRLAAPHWKCIYPTEIVAGSVIMDPHKHIFVLSCPGIPSAPQVEVRAEAMGEEALVYSAIEYDSRRETPTYRLAACTMVRSDASIDELTEWIEYHRIQGWDHFSLYVDGPMERIAGAFDGHNGTVSVVDWHWPDRGFQHQQAEMNSCLYRYRGGAEWVAFFDMDEFFQPITSSTSILDLIRKVPPRYGGWGARHVLFALPSHSIVGQLVTQTVVERSAEALPFTFRSKCIVRPYEVSTMGVHEITSGNTLTWVADPVTEARLNHYKAGLKPEGQVVHDTSMLHFADALRSTKDTKSFVSVYLTGRLGNQLFQAASSFGIALARGGEWCIPYLKGSVLHSSVRFTAPPRTDCVPEGVHVADEAGDFLRFQKWMLHEHPGESLRVGVYLQSFHYFSNVSRLPFELNNQASANEWVRGNNITVGMHVRRTDMLENLGNDPTIAYFKEALARMRDALGPIQAKNIVVCTDDPAWVHTQVEVFGGMIVRTGTDYVEDMAVLAACQHLILSIGTFGWWAAYLRASPGHTYYYAEPLRKPPSAYAEHFPATWTPISLT